ncbi:c-type cytochrome [Maritalea mediterranea]|uniref:Cytochrome c family protein n=1 Tax=Maritalea mediterranea TaxID=2909667 RepID=A0ABS9E7W6_9HYPH|nr:cytochrome c family protein [Maritalea mediterranea]MCF4098978.1 cytochrome c family protein [Maritalea mediterranea]
MKKLSLLVAVLLAFNAPAFADGDADEGEGVFKKCKSCHMVGEGAKSRVGPPLNNIFGQTAGTQEGYKYSNALVEAGEEGLVWTPETIDQYLEKPRAFVKGTKMSFAGLRKEEDRADLIAYLLQFSPDYNPEAVSDGVTQ